MVKLIPVLFLSRYRRYLLIISIKTLCNRFKVSHFLTALYTEAPLSVYGWTGYGVDPRQNIICFILFELLIKLALDAFVMLTKFTGLSSANIKKK